MNNFLEFQKFHIRTQLFQYLLPPMFLYFILLPSHYSLLNYMNEVQAVRFFDDLQKYFILTELWVQYLGFRFMLCQELKEISNNVGYIRKVLWMCNQLILSYVIFLPYSIIILLKSEIYFSNVWVLILQCSKAGIISFYVMYLSGSAIGGLAVMSGYYFLCVNHFIPYEFSMMFLGGLPKDFELNWYLSQVIIMCGLLVGGTIIGRIKDVYV